MPNPYQTNADPYAPHVPAAGTGAFGELGSNPTGSTVAPTVPAVPVAPAPVAPVPPSPGIVSTEQHRADYNNGSADLQNMEQNDPYAQIMQRQIDQNNAGSRTDNANITAQSARAQFQEIQGANEYQAGLRTAGIQSGSARYTPELYQGLIESARRGEADRINELQNKETLAIATAKQARDDRNVTLMKEQIDHIKQLRKEKADALENQITGNARVLAYASDLAPSIAQNSERIPAGPQRDAYLQSMADQYGIKNLDILRAAITNYHIKNTKAASSGKGGGKKYTATNIPTKDRNDLIEDIGTRGVTLDQLYANYPDVSSSYISSLYRSLRASSGRQI